MRLTGDAGEWARLYRTPKEIGFHCDAAGVVGLMCLEETSSASPAKPSNPIFPPSSTS